MGSTTQHSSQHKPIKKIVQVNQMFARMPACPHGRALVRMDSQHVGGFWTGEGSRRRSALQRDVENETGGLPTSAPPQSVDGCRPWMRCSHVEPAEVG